MSRSVVSPPGSQLPRVRHRTGCGTFRNLVGIKLASTWHREVAKLTRAHPIFFRSAKHRNSDSFVATAQTRRDSCWACNSILRIQVSLGQVTARTVVAPIPSQNVQGWICADCARVFLSHVFQTAQQK